VIRRCTYLLLLLVFLLTACGTGASGDAGPTRTPRAIPTEVPTATPRPTQTPVPPTATRTAVPTRPKPSPTATLVPTMPPSPTVTKLEGKITVRESQGRCEMHLPGGYDADPGGVDTWVSADRLIFIGLESVEMREATSIDAALQRGTEHLRTVIGGYEETASTQTFDTRRVGFSGRLGQGSAWGTLYLRQFGLDYCQITIIAAEGTTILLDPILETMVSSLGVLLYNPAPIGYLALGDSFAVGTGASDPATKGYAGLFATYLRGEKQREIVYTNQGIAGATSADFLGDWPTAGREGTSPLANAVRALAAGNINVVTLDIGGNDILRLLKPGQPCEGEKIESDACFTAMRAALREMTTPNLTQIVAALVEAAPAGTQIIVLNYPNPFSIGKSSTTEERTDAAMTELNILISNAVSMNQPTATRRNVSLALVDVVPRFAKQGAKLTHIADGKPDIHPNDAGYAAIVEAIKKVYRRP
jgi:lysophospholipase L1-like esterase